MTSYYNEIDPYAAQWLCNLIEAGHIAPGVVDTRSIEDVRPSDLAGFTQCHFFAGIGVWSYALRRAGWADDRPVWTGSCPCQPFSSAGQGAGFADERHLWPAWHYLIRECKPAAIFGEQVASKDAEPWLDLVQDDMEGMGYAFGAIPFPSAGVGAPHIRDRLYFVAHAANSGRLGRRAGRASDGGNKARVEFERLCNSGELAHGGGAGLEWRDARAVGHERATAERGGSACELGHAHGERSGRDARRPSGPSESSESERCADRQHGTFGVEPAGATRGFWANAEWIACRDGKARPVEPGTFPLAHGAPARVGRLRAYGNAINAEAARVFIECAMNSEAG